MVLQGQSSTPLVVSTGSNVTLTFQVQADPIPSVQWYFNGSLIQSNTTYQSNITQANNITGSTLYNASLLINYVDLTTQGYYYASFSNRAGTQNTSSVFVTPPGKALMCVASTTSFCLSLPPSPPPLPLPSPSSSTVTGVILSFTAVPACITLGSTIQLVCPVYGYPIPNVTFDGDTLSGRFSQTGNTLTIANLTSIDSTRYTCRTSSAQMSVQPLLCRKCPPHDVLSSLCECPCGPVAILSAAGGGVVTTGSLVNMVCSSNIDLNGQTITWYRSGAVVLSITIDQASPLTSTLTLSNVQTTDSGLYSCSVPGVSSNNVTLTVTAGELVHILRASKSSFYHVFCSHGGGVCVFGNSTR